MNISEYRTTIHLTEEQREYVEARRKQRSRELNMRVGIADVMREAVELLREHKPVDSDPVEAAVS